MCIRIRYCVVSTQLGFCISGREREREMREREERERERERERECVCVRLRYPGVVAWHDCISLRSHMFRFAENRSARNEASGRPTTRVKRNHCQLGSKACYIDYSVGSRDLRGGSTRLNPEQQRRLLKRHFLFPVLSIIINRDRRRTGN
jgi:hypothetical protein